MATLTKNMTKEEIFQLKNRLSPFILKESLSLFKIICVILYVLSNQDERMFDYGIYKW